MLTNLRAWRQERPSLRSVGTALPLTILALVAFVVWPAPSLSRYCDSTQPVSVTGQIRSWLGLSQCTAKVLRRQTPDDSSIASSFDLSSLLIEPKRVSIARPKLAPACPLNGAADRHRAGSPPRIDNVYIIGERISGTNAMTHLLRSNLDTRLHNVSSFFEDHKHWFQVG